MPVSIIRALLINNNETLQNAVFSVFTKIYTIQDLRATRGRVLLNGLCDMNVRRDM